MSLDGLKHIKNMLSTKINLSNQIIEKDNKIKSLEKELLITKDKVKTATDVLLKVRQNKRAKMKIKDLEGKIESKKIDRDFDLVINIIFPITVIYTPSYCSYNKALNILVRKKERTERSIKTITFKETELLKIEGYLVPKLNSFNEI